MTQLTILTLKLQRKVEHTAAKYMHKESFCFEAQSSSKLRFFVVVCHRHNMDRHTVSSLGEG